MEPPPHLKFYGKFICFRVHFLHLPNFVTTTGHNIKKSGLSKSSVSVLTLDSFLYLCKAADTFFCPRWDRNLHPHRHSS